VIGMLAGRPAAEDWDDQMRTLTRLMGGARGSMRFGWDETHHRRGDYPAVNTGISYGGGTKAGLAFAHAGALR
jgi:hypothetical protein